MNPLLVLIVTIGAGAIFGMVGLILAAPLTSAAIHISGDLAKVRVGGSGGDDTDAAEPEPERSGDVRMSVQVAAGIPHPSSPSAIRPASAGWSRSWLAGRESRSSSSCSICSESTLSAGCEDLWDQIKEVPAGYIVAALLFQTGHTLFAGVSYYGILNAAYPGEVQLAPVVTAYAVGVR